VDEVLDNIINIFQPQALQKKISLTLATESQKGLILDADSALLQQALYNLVDNAVRFTGLDGKVEIKVEERQFSDIFEIHDSGIGIAPIDLPRVFEKFYRSGRHDANVQRGTGLGLAIVKSIADRHEGKVWVESQLGKGSVFFLEIPKQPQHEN
jgi:two-component system phosphate regulon sensor histidine kinase PhoR